MGKFNIDKISKDDQIELEELINTLSNH